MARPSITGDSDLVEDQIQREAETHGNSNSSPKKKKCRHSQHGKRSEERNHRNGGDNMNSKDIIDPGHDRMASFAEKNPLESSPSKKRKRNKHRDQSKLYEVPGVENLPAKRKTSYRIAQDFATGAIQDDKNDTPVEAAHSNNVSSYLGESPFMSPPKALVSHSAVLNTVLKSTSTQQARLDTILKTCSRKTVANAVLDEMEPNNESDGSPSPPTSVNPVTTVKMEHEAPRISLRDIVRACDSKDGRVTCPIEGCEKSYTRKDSLSGHMAVSSGQFTLSNLLYLLQ